MSEHSDVDFQREQLAKFSAEQDDAVNLPEGESAVEEGKESSPISPLPRPRKKRLKGPIPTAEAATLVQQGKLCGTIGCVRRPLFNFKGLRPRLCRQHKEENMINIKEKFCQHDGEGGCENAATHFHRGDKKSKKLCIDHKEDGMTIIVVSGLLCVHEGCKKSASFNLRGMTSRYCMTHKTPEMINIYREKKLCYDEGCSLSASFNFPGKKVARFCSLHKVKGMINLKSPLCFAEGCATQPYYHWPGEKRGKFCSTHKEPGMINLQIVRTNRVCDRSGCEKCACFAFAKTDAARYCSAHKERGMMDVQNATCEHEDCEKRPNFNFSGARKGRFCAVHREDGMTNVTNERKRAREEEKEVTPDTAGVSAAAAASSASSQAPRAAGGTRTAAAAATAGASSSAARTRAPAVLPLGISGTFV